MQFFHLLSVVVGGNVGARFLIRYPTKADAAIMPIAFQSKVNDPAFKLAAMVYNTGTITANPNPFKNVFKFIIFNF